MLLRYIQKEEARLIKMAFFHHDEDRNWVTVLGFMGILTILVVPVIWLISRYLGYDIRENLLATLYVGTTYFSLYVLYLFAPLIEKLKWRIRKKSTTELSAFEIHRLREKIRDRAHLRELLDIVVPVIGVFVILILLLFAG